MRWAHRLITLATALTVLVGPPLLLLAVWGSPVPSRWPQPSQVRQWITNPVTGDTVLAAIVTGVWLLWAAVAITVLVRFAAGLRRGMRWLTRVAVPTPMQATASGLVGAALLGTGTASAAPTAGPSGDHTTSRTATGVGQPQFGSTVDAGTRTVTVSDGVTLPDGSWLPPGTADAVASAAALTWLRRRLTYRPHPPTTHGDIDLAPLPPTVTAVQTTRPTPPATTPPAPAPVGTTADRPLHPHDLPSGLALTGPGAADAARGILLAVLLNHHSPGPAVITTAADLTALLGPDADRFHHIPGLHVADAINDQRARQHTSGSGTGRSVPPLLIAHFPAAEHLTALTHDAAGNHPTVILVGAAPAGTTWQVHTDGTTTNPDQTGTANPRLCVLTRTAAVDLLTLTRHTPAHLQRPCPAVAIPAQPATAGQPAQTPDGTGSTGRVTPDDARHRPALRLRILGPITLTHAGAPVVIQRSAAIQVLVLLAAYPDGATTNQLTTALWPHLPGHAVTSRLYTSISQLRRTLQPIVGAAVIDRVDDRYRLHPDHIDVDLWRLHDAIDHAATAHAHDQHLHTAISLYTGEVAAGYHWPWLPPVRETARRHAINAYTTLAASQSDAQQALRLLQQALRIEPLNEDLHYRAADILTDLGDTAAATDLRTALSIRLAAHGLTTRRAAE